MEPGSRADTSTATVLGRRAAAGPRGRRDTVPVTASAGGVLSTFTAHSRTPTLPGKSRASTRIVWKPSESRRVLMVIPRG